MPALALALVALLPALATAGSDTCGPRGVTGVTRVWPPYIAVFDGLGQDHDRGVLFVGSYSDFDSDALNKVVRRNQIASVAVPLGLRADCWERPNYGGQKWVVQGPYEGNLNSGTGIDNWDSCQITVQSGFYVDIWRRSSSANDLAFSDSFFACEDHPLTTPTSVRAWDCDDYTCGSIYLGGAGSSDSDMDPRRNWIASMQIPFGLEVTAWEAPGYTGNRWFYPGGNYWQLPYGHDDIDAYQVSRADWCGWRYNQDVCGWGSNGRFSQDGCNYRRCGDGSRQSGEECDDGNCDNSDFCLASCRNNVCGDGHHNTASGSTEQCDNGNGNSNTGACTLSCKTARCGDGLVFEGTEECDTSLSPCSSCMLGFDAAVSVSNVTPFSFTVHWDEPATSIAHSQITGYLVDVWDRIARVDGSPFYASPGVDLIASVTGLEPNTLHRVRVKALTAADDGSGPDSKYSPFYESEDHTRTTCGCTAEPTGAPTSFSVVQRPGGSLAFSWIDNSLCETSFGVRRDSDVVENFVVAAEADCGEQFEPLTTVDIANPRLLPGSSYEFCLFAAGLEGYRSDLSCQSIVVAFETVVRISVQTEQNTPVTDVVVNVALPGGSFSSTKLTDGRGEAVFSIFAPGYSSESIDAVVTVSKQTGDHVHEFACGSSSCSAPGEQIVTVGHLDFVGQTVSFIDESAFSVSGTVSLDNTAAFTTTERNCPVDRAQVCAYDTSSGQRRELTCVETDPLGEYELAVANGLAVDLEVSLANHTFAQTVQSLVVSQPTSGVDFLDTSVSTVELTVGGGACNAYIGRAQIAIKGVDCTEYEQVIDMTAKMQTVTVASQLYDVVFRELLDVEDANVDGISRPDVPVYLDAIGVRTQHADLRANPLQRVGLEWYYRVPPTLELTTSAQSNPCGNDWPLILGQFRRYNVTVTVAEYYGAERCDRVDGEVRAFDTVSGDGSRCGIDNGGCLLQLEHDEGLSRVVMPIVPLEPRVFQGLGAEQEGEAEPSIDDYTSVLAFEMLTPARDPVVAELVVLVTGHRVRGDRYPLRMPAHVPWLILRDPPGDQSFAELSTQTTNSVAWTMSTASAQSNEDFVTLGVGVEAEMDLCAGFGVETCQDTLKIEASFGSSVSESEGSEIGQADTATFEITTSQRFATSGYAGFTGDGADQFLLPSLSISYALSDEVGFNFTTCAVETDVFLTWEPLPLEPNALAWQSAYDIRETIIPALETVLDAEEDAALQVELEDGIRGWRDLLDQNDALKARAQPLALPGSGNVTADGFSRISFSGGGSALELSTTSTSSSTHEVTFSAFIEEAVATELSTKIAVFSVAQEQGLKFGTTFKVTVGSSQSTSQSTSTTTSVTLADKDLGDNFDVDVLVDPVYSTMVFRTHSGESWCPHEIGTVPRETFALTADRGLYANVPPEDAAVFKLTIVNQSPTLEARTLSLVPLQNPGALNIKYAGAPVVGPIQLRDLPLGETELVFEAYRGPLDYDYDVVFQVYSECEWDLYNGDGLTRYYMSETVSLSFSFLRPCSTAEFGGELAARGTWEVSLAEQREDQLYVVVRNPSYARRTWAGDDRLRSVQLQYRQPAEAEWTLARNIDGALADLVDLEDEFGFAEFRWYVRNLPDGIYELRVRTDCEPTVASLASLDSFETPHIRGVIDRATPELFGLPEPADGIYWPGDELSFTFDENVLCTLPHTFSVALATAGTGDSIDHRTVCEGRQILVGFGPGAQFDELMGRGVEMSVTNVRDLLSNRATRDFRWEFQVPELEMSAVTADLRGLTFALDFDSVAGRFDSPEREAFTTRLEQEVATAMEIHPNRVRIDDVREGMGDTVEVDLTVLAPTEDDTATATQAVSTFHRRVSDEDDLFVTEASLLSAIVYDEARRPSFRVLSTRAQPENVGGRPDTVEQLDRTEAVGVAVAGTAVACAALGAALFVAAKRKGYVVVPTKESKDIPLQDLGA